MNAIRLHLLAVSLMLPVLLPACDRDAPPKGPTSSGATVEEPKTPSTSVVEKSNDIPADVPPDAPVVEESGLPQIDLSRLDPSKSDQIRRAQKLVEEAPGSASRIGELGMQYLALGFEDAAVQCFGLAIERVPAAMEFRYLRGLANQALGNLEDAERDYRKAIELDATYVPAYVNLGEILKLRNDAAALAMYEKALEIDPNDVIALAGVAGYRENNDQMDDAIRLLSRILDLQPDNADAHFSLSRIYKRSGDDALAAKHMKAYETGRKPIITNDPLRFEIVRRTRDEGDIAKEAIEMAKSGEPERAAKYLERAIDSGIDGPAIRSALGGVYLARKDFPFAIIQFRAGLALLPDSADMRSNLAYALAESGQLDEAERIFEQIVAETPNDAVTMNRLGMLLARRGDADGAKSMLQKALKADPDSSVYRLNLADLLINTGHTDDAAKVLESISSASPDYGKKLFLMGLIDARASRLGDARDNWERAIAASPDLEQAYLALAQLSIMDGNPREALNILLNGINKSTGTAELKNDAAWILATSPDDSIRNGSLAVQLAESANALDGNRRNNFVGTLAAAYAEAGRFEDANKTANRAAEMARNAGLEKEASQHEARAALYAQKKAYRTAPTP